MIRQRPAPVRFRVPSRNRRGNVINSNQTITLDPAIMTIVNPNISIVSGAIIALDPAIMLMTAPNIDVTNMGGGGGSTSGFNKWWKRFRRYKG